MTQANTFISETDQSLERRHALAKVYSLLLRLAEEDEQVSNAPTEQEIVDEVQVDHNDSSNSEKSLNL